ncbi:MAG: hypothetical protein EAX96_17855 [Candidatus Lokiarchaeota archaeon]|nr:hypothetical protein [Candidatus Lokiarchaeota archaeon]
MSICAIISTVVITTSIIIILPMMENDGGPTIYTKTLQLDEGATCTITSCFDFNIENVTNTGTLPEYFILNVVKLDPKYQESTGWINITFYSPTGFGEFDHIGFAKNGIWTPIPCNISADGKNISAQMDVNEFERYYSVIRYPEVQISLEAKRQDEQTIALTKNTANQILLPMGMKNWTYSLRLQAEGGNGTYKWALSTGTLPAGIVISETGILSGNASVIGNFTFEFNVSSADRNIEEVFNLTLVDYVPNELLPTDTTLPPAWYSEKYLDLLGDNVTICFGGGTSGPFVIYNLSALPNGLSFNVWENNSHACVNFTGTCTAMTGTYNFTMVGHDEIYDIWGTNDTTIGNYIERIYYIIVG